MKISIVGTGYVGLVTGACLAEAGNKVCCVDIDHDKVEALKNGVAPFYEPGIETLLEKCRKNGTLSFTTDLEQSLNDSNIVFIAVGTPMQEDGSANLDHVLKVATDIGRLMTHKLLVINKSTVPVGTADLVSQQIAKELKKRNKDVEYDVASNPEFLKQGNAIADFSKPDRVIIGSSNQNSIETLRELYRPFCMNHSRFIVMDVKSAEMTKYTANALLATKISFMNEVASICKSVGADVNQVRLGIGADQRIGYSFIYPGCGYGGSCFPKDTRALSHLARENGINPQLIDAVNDVNERQKRVLIDEVTNHFGEDLSSLTFAVWGLAFKPETDDMREAPALTIISELVAKGATVQAYDPQAMAMAENYWLKDLNISYAADKYDALDGADAMLLLTEWKEFRSLDFSQMKKHLKNPIIFDGRNQYSREEMELNGFKYIQIGVR